MTKAGKRAVAIVFVLWSVVIGVGVVRGFAALPPQVHSTGWLYFGAGCAGGLVPGVLVALLERVGLAGWGGTGAAGGWAAGIGAGAGAGLWALLSPLGELALAGGLGTAFLGILFIPYLLRDRPSPYVTGPDAGRE